MEHRVAIISPGSRGRILPEIPLLRRFKLFLAIVPFLIIFYIILFIVLPASKPAPPRIKPAPIFNAHDVTSAKVPEKLIIQERAGDFTNVEASHWKVLANGVVVHVGQSRNPHNYTYLINSPKLCRTHGKLHLLFIVPSWYGNADRRRAVRATWGHRMLQDTLNFRVLFLLSDPLNKNELKKAAKEADLYGDIVMENFKDSGENVVLKTIMGLKWATRFCTNADFVVKTDDDIVIHISNLLKITNVKITHTNALMCSKNPKYPIFRTPEEHPKYYVSEQELPGDYYPEYCKGILYIMPMEVAHSLYQASQKTPNFYIEDVYVTGLCRMKAGLAIIDYTNITPTPMSLDSARCQFDLGRINSLELTVEEMREMWERLNARNSKCSFSK